MFISSGLIKQEDGEKLMLSQMGLEKFEFLRKMALEMGAVDAKIITTDKVVVEDRIVLKCTHLNLAMVGKSVNSFYENIYSVHYLKKM